MSHVVEFLCFKCWFFCCIGKKVILSSFCSHHTKENWKERQTKAWNNNKGKLSKFYRCVCCKSLSKTILQVGNKMYKYGVYILPYKKILLTCLDSWFGCPLSTLTVLIFVTLNCPFRNQWSTPIIEASKIGVFELVDSWS